jgi:protein-L-isoaspartate(D-aspartate) O-methyltransferase
MNPEEYTIELERMLREQIIARGVCSPAVLAAMRSVPRHLFIPPEQIAYAYADGPLPIGHGQTISQPYIVALMTELLEVEPGARLLEIGTGSGYQAAVLGRIAAQVHTLELIPELARNAEQALTELGMLNVHVHLADGSLGWVENAPYDGILVTAACPAVPPALCEQLAEAGRLVLPVGGRGMQRLEVHQRVRGKIACEQNIPVAFVPLRGEFGWKS